MKQDRQKHALPEGHDPESYSAESARGGEIILKSRSRRIVFVTGLVAAVVVGLIAWFVVI